MTSEANKPQQAIERLWPRVTTNPELHFHQFDVIRQACLFVHMPPGAYRAATFLDGRSFTQQTLAGWIPWQRVRETVLGAPVPATPLHFIFHMGHTGSTLLSRLLDESGMVQSLREPLVLRELAALHDQDGSASCLVSPEELKAIGEVMLRLWSRCAQDRQCAVLKATSATARVGEMLMAARPNARAVYLSMEPEPYLAVILGGPASLLDVRGHAEERMRRLSRLLTSAPKPLYAMSPGELAASSWLAEALTRERLGRQFDSRILPVDFDRFLTDIAQAMSAILGHLGIPGGEDLAGRLAGSPSLGQYAKAPEHAYSSRLRQEVIENSRRQNGAEIKRGLALLQGLAKENGNVAKLLGSAF